MKKLLSVLLALAFVLAMAPAPLAASDEAVNAANSLYDMGLFLGVGEDANGNPIFELDRAPTRHEAVTMLVRLLGAEAEAKSKSWSTPFTDVANWAKPYVGYAASKGLTAGTSDTTFSGNDTITASQYLTFVLRALGYSSGGDFQWDSAWTLSDRIGITNGQFDQNHNSCTRGDVAVISYKALSANMNMSNTTLKEYLGDAIASKPSGGSKATYTKEEATIVAQALGRVAEYSRSLGLCLAGSDLSGALTVTGKMRNDVSIVLQLALAHSDSVSAAVVMKLQAYDTLLQKISLAASLGQQAAAVEAFSKLESGDSLMSLVEILPVE